MKLSLTDLSTEIGSDFWTVVSSQIETLLMNFALDAKFLDQLTLAFGSDLNQSLAVDLGQQLAIGDLSSIPSIGLVPSESIKYAFGAYAASVNQIYLSQDFVLANLNNPNSVARIILEEFGHSLDTLINSSDSPGDEGEIFASLVLGEELPADQLKRLRNEADAAIVTIDGQPVLIEKSTSTFRVISGDGKIIAPEPGANLGSDGLRDSRFIVGFEEQQNVLLTSPLDVDGPTDIAPGTQVNSYMLFLNRESAADGSVRRTATWEFDGNILGVMSDSRGHLEAASNGLLGNSNVIYPGAFRNRGFERGDSYSINGNQLTLNMRVTEPGDWVRVITGANPAPELTVELGYGEASELPDVNSTLSRRSFVKELAQSVQIESQLVASNQLASDGQLDGYRYFIQPKDDSEFTQTIKITNGNGAGTAQTVSFEAEVRNSAFIRLPASGFSAKIFNADNTVANGAPNFTISPDLDPDPDTERYGITFTNVNLAAGQYILLQAVSDIDQQAFDSPDSNNLAERNLSFQLDNKDGLDWGDGNAVGRVYLDRAGFEKQDGNGNPSNTGFSFAPLPDSKLVVSNLSFQAPATPSSVFQVAQTLRGYAEYSGVDTTPNSQGSFDREKTLFLFELFGDVDFLKGGRGGSVSDELSLDDELRLFWINRPDLDPQVAAYTAASDLDDAYLILLGLLEGGIGDIAFSTDANPKDPVDTSQFNRSGLSGQGGFTQDAESGELVSTVYAESEAILRVQYVNRSGPIDLDAHFDLNKDGIRDPGEGIEALGGNNGGGFFKDAGDCLLVNPYSGTNHPDYVDITVQGRFGTKNGVSGYAPGQLRISNSGPAALVVDSGGASQFGVGDEGPGNRDFNNGEVIRFDLQSGYTAAQAIITFGNNFQDLGRSIPDTNDIDTHVRLYKGGSLIETVAVDLSGSTTVTVRDNLSQAFDAIEVQAAQTHAVLSLQGVDFFIL